MNDNIRTARRAYSRVGLALVMILAVTMALQLLWTLIPLLIWGDEHWMVSSSWGTLLGSFLPMYLLGIPAGLVVLSTVPGEVPENNKLSAKHFWMALPITYVFVYAGSLTGNFLSTLLSGGTAENPVVEMTDATVNAECLTASPKLPNISRILRAIAIIAMATTPINVRISELKASFHLPLKAR